MNGDDGEDTPKTRKYQITKDLKPEAERQISRYYACISDIRAVVKDNFLTEGQKKALIVSMQDEMKRCKLRLEQLELLSIGGITRDSYGDIIKH